MATFLSSPLSPGARPTPGERRLADRFSDLLEDDYLCWYNVPVGPKHQHPDFVLLHPGRGLLILEVKDWKLDTIKDANPMSFLLDDGAGHKHVANPLEQVRAYAHAVTNVLERDRQLTHPPGDPYAGKLAFPYGYGVVLTNITRRQFETSGLDQVMPAHLVLCKDEMTESADAEGFQKRLWDMFNVRFASKLTLPQVDRIRGLLFPEIRVSQPGLLPGTADPDLRVLDLKQEAVARSLGEGHRVIHGVAGSGKTLILAYRCQHLARTVAKPILVLVYNKALAAWLQSQMVERGLSDRVVVRNFHGWCSDLLTLYHVPQPTSTGEAFFGDMVEAVIAGVDRGQIPRAQYGALLIDEGHDFESAWLKLAVQMLDPESNSLLLLYDDAQSINIRHRSRNFRTNYRNTDEILSCAREFARDILTPVDADDDGVPSLMPELGGRSGPRPAFRALPSTDAEAACIAAQALRLHARGIAWREIGVFYTAPFVGEAVMSALDRAGVPVAWLKDAKSKQFDPASDSVKLMTVQSCKGLQYRVAIVAGAGFLPYRSEPDDARLLYVAMTRATHELIVTTSKSSVFSERLKVLCQPLAA